MVKESNESKEQNKESGADTKSPRRRNTQSRAEELTLGQLLRRTREMRNLGIDDVVQQVLVSKKTILALESDDYSQIAAPTYARGYLRSYAQLLRISEEEVLAGYEKLNPDVGSGHKYDDVKYNLTSHKELYKKMRWVGYVLAALLIFLVIAWVWSGHNSNKSEQNLVGDNVEFEQQADAAKKVDIAPPKVTSENSTKKKVTLHTPKHSKKSKAVKRIHANGSNYHVQDIDDDYDF